MKAVLCFVLLLLGCALANMAGECTMAGFYLELGCTPVGKDANSTCPTSFTCPDLHPNRTMCYYKGVAYNNRASIPADLLMNLCTPACTCEVVDGEPQFNCGLLDCFETFDSEECVFTYELNSCCSTGTICGKDAIAELKTCDYEGKTYYEGQTFEPKNTQKICLCTADWDGRVDNTSYCKDINCGLELHYQSMLMDNCAPLFYGNDVRCPIGFQCPSSRTEVVRGLNLRNTEARCVFGNETLTVGDEVSVEEQCTKCSCEVPPFVTCRTNANDCA